MIYIYQKDLRDNEVYNLSTSFKFITVILHFLLFFFKFIQTKHEQFFKTDRNLLRFEHI